MVIPCELIHSMQIGLDVPEFRMTAVAEPTKINLDQIILWLISIEGPSAR